MYLDLTIIRETRCKVLRHPNFERCPASMAVFFLIIPVLRRKRLCYISLLNSRELLVPCALYSCGRREIMRPYPLAGR